MTELEKEIMSYKKDLEVNEALIEKSKERLEAQIAGLTQQLNHNTQLRTKLIDLNLKLEEKRAQEETGKIKVGDFVQIVDSSSCLNDNSDLMLNLVRRAAQDYWEEQEFIVHFAYGDTPSPEGIYEVLYIQDYSFRTDSSDYLIAPKHTDKFKGYHRPIYIMRNKGIKKVKPDKVSPQDSAKFLSDHSPLGVFPI